MLKVLLTSTNQKKQDAVKIFFDEIKKQITLDSKNCDNLAIPPQPVDCSLSCALKRIDSFNDILNNYDVVVSIQNDISQDCNTRKYFDNACAIIRLNNGVMGNGCGIKIECPIQKEPGYPIFPYGNKGYHTTAGEYFKSANLAKSADNWMLDIANIDRSEQILVALREAYKDLNTKQKQ